MLRHLTGFQRGLRTSTSGPNSVPGELWRHPVYGECLIPDEDLGDDRVINRLSPKEPVGLFHDFFRGVDNLQ